jgi:hypothetical protein
MATTASLKIVITGLSTQRASQGTVHVVNLLSNSCKLTSRPSTALSGRTHSTASLSQLWVRESWLRLERFVLRMSMMQVCFWHRSSLSAFHTSISTAATFVASHRMVRLFLPFGWQVAQGPEADKRDIRGPSNASSPRESWWRWRRHRFSAIGWGYVVLMILIFSLSSAWSLLLVILNVEPSRSANYILQTESLDNGYFWQSHTAEAPILATSTSLLLVVIAVYWYLLYLLLLRPPARRIHSQERKPQQPNFVLRKMPTVEKIVEQQRKKMRHPLFLLVRRVVGRLSKIYRSVVSTDGKYRKVWVSIQ